MGQHESDKAAEAAAGDHSFPTDGVGTLAELRRRQNEIVAAEEGGVGIPEKPLDGAIAESGLEQATIGRAFRYEEERLTKAFTYHAPTVAQQVSLQRINQAAHALAHMILLEVPPCGDQRAAIRLVREARMTANAGIVLEGAI